jgi:hypothetical protein
MVCTDCLKLFYGGVEKCCSHGIDYETGRQKRGVCGECGNEGELHCPDGPRIPGLNEVRIEVKL